ncbi:tumor necrosis factor ligand superfamily member 14-like [Pristis pectinata]|uniref:tumor necrosis factor ligand superfamily member 14-like n=1 Tax=Pristis pectinata TaxID=685728 RepID=UPI00223DB3F2|nr:tumor necrosis factor ligand superfamily member 14-like [Pristis pectinata]
MAENREQPKQHKSSKAMEESITEGGAGTELSEVLVMTFVMEAVLGWMLSLLKRMSRFFILEMGDSFAYPSVFVVDGRSDTVPFATSNKRKKLTLTHKFLGMLVLLALVGDGLGAFYLWKLRFDVQEFNSMFLTVKNSSLNARRIQDLILQDSTRPAAHVTGCNCSASRHDRLHWEFNRGNAFLRGIDYKEGALVIKKSGHYFIYSKILLGEISCAYRD